ncbi:MAG: hypothetical protein CBC35_10320 [Planctomycetes bacterium TMED75]|nr:hypothetical protein [Planctomycetaceae bacterium]OUU91151.1 MAG: hypothetical protein CBC35_10320 [Planctomycetes bacterium TMED75]
MNKTVRRAKRLDPGEVFAFDIRSSRLSFDNISSRYRRQLEDSWGTDARTKYESKVSQKMAAVIRQIRNRVPGIKIGVVGFPEVPTSSSTSGFNQNYSELLSAVDVFLPRLTAENSSPLGMESLMALAGDRPIMPASYQQSGFNESAASNTGDAGSENSSISVAEIEALLDALTSQEAINMMQTAWGTADSTWDFNGDGVVGGQDLAILLAYLGNLGEEANEADDNQDSGDSDGNTDDDPDIDPGVGGDFEEADSGSDSGNDENGNESDSEAGGDESSSGDGFGSDPNEAGGDGTDVGNDQNQVDDSGIGVLVPGSGFNGNYGNPMRVGSSASPGYGAKSIARWTEFPFITRSEDFYVTISAFHMTDIDRVEFILNGGEPTVTREVQPHPETGYAEYIAKIDVSELPTGINEIRAIVYPNHGIPRILQGAHNAPDLHRLNNGNQSFWFNYEPSPRTVRVGPNSQFSTIDEAISSMGSLITSGRIELEAGEYTWFKTNHSSLNNTDDNKVLTICAAPGVTRDEIILRGHTSMNAGAKYLSIHLKGMTIIAERPAASSSNGVVIRGTGAHNNRLFVEDIFFTSHSDGPIPGWASSDLPEVTKVLTNWSGGMWVKDMDFENFPGGISTVYLAKHTTFNRSSKDCWGQSPGAVINCFVDKHDHYNADHLMHPDIIHFHVNGDFIENRIFADITATNDYAQIGHLEWASKLSNFAFARWKIDARYASQSLNFNPDFDHLVMTDCTFRSCSVDFMNFNKRVLLRNLHTYKYRGNEVSSTFHPSTTIIDNVHFTVEHAGSPSWATHGPVNWAAPSPPAGSASDGTGQYISSLVQSESELTSWSLGNPNADDQTDHFYYDPALLDLRWWR